MKEIKIQTKKQKRKTLKQLNTINTNILLLNSRQKPNLEALPNTSRCIGLGELQRSWKTLLQCRNAPRAIVPRRAGSGIYLKPQEEQKRWVVIPQLPLAEVVTECSSSPLDSGKGS